MKYFVYGVLCALAFLSAHGADDECTAATTQEDCCKIDKCAYANCTNPDTTVTTGCYDSTAWDKAACGELTTVCEDANATTGNATTPAPAVTTPSTSSNTTTTEATVTTQSPNVNTTTQSPNNETTQAGNGTVTDKPTVPTTTQGETNQTTPKPAEPTTKGETTPKPAEPTTQGETTPKPAEPTTQNGTVTETTTPKEEGGTTTGANPIPTSQQTPECKQGQHFDAASFIGGIVLCGGVIIIIFFACKFYKSRSERTYHQF